MGDDARTQANNYFNNLEGGKPDGRPVSDQVSVLVGLSLHPQLLRYKIEHTGVMAGDGERAAWSRYKIDGDDWIDLKRDDSDFGSFNVSAEGHIPIPVGITPTFLFESSNDNAEAHTGKPRIEIWLNRG